MQAFDWRRWQLPFFDDFAYLPTSQFGFGGLSGIGAPGLVVRFLQYRRFWTEYTYQPDHPAYEWATL